MVKPGSTLSYSRNGGHVEPANDRDPRRVVDLEGFATLEDGKAIPLHILDLTYDGCKARTAVALIPGVKLKLSVLGLRGALNATVRWAKHGEVGLRFDAEILPTKEQKPRQCDRVNTSAELSLRRVGRIYYRCQIEDLSPAGCKVEFVERPRCGELVWIKFDGFDAIEAVVRWVDRFHGGVQFVRPLHPAIFDVLLMKLGAT